MLYRFSTFSEKQFMQAFLANHNYGKHNELHSTLQENVGGITALNSIIAVLDQSAKRNLKISPTLQSDLLNRARDIIHSDPHHHAFLKGLFITLALNRIHHPQLYHAIIQSTLQNHALIEPTHLVTILETAFYNRVIQR